jgi:hypothetical protein
MLDGNNSTHQTNLRKKTNHARSDATRTRAEASFLRKSDAASVAGDARHKDVHYRLIAKEIAALVPGADARVLDYGSGEAAHADLVAQVAGELLLCEAAPGVREALARRFAGNAKIRVLAPHEATRLPEHSSLSCIRCFNI